LAVISPDNRRLTAWMGALITWDPATGRQAWSVRRPHDSSGPSALAISADGRTLATGSDDGFIRLWDPTDGQPLGRLSGHGAGASGTGLAFLPDGRSLLSCGTDGTARLWELTSGEERKRFSQKTAMSGLRLSSDGSLAAFSTSPRGITLWRPMAAETEAA